MSKPPTIAALQSALADAGLDGWLFYDLHHRDPVAYRLLGLDQAPMTTRRWFYFVPARGEPRGLFHRVEPDRLAGLAGALTPYSSWRELADGLAAVLEGVARVAMQYSPGGAVPSVSLVDGGTVDMVRAAGVDVASSADLLQLFDAVLDDEGQATHRRAGELLHAIKDGAFARVADVLRAGRTITEYDLQRWILERFAVEGLTSGADGPIVGVDDHPANPHFAPTAENARPIVPGSCLLVDLWAKLATPGAVFHDITWCAYVGAEPPAPYRQIFDVVVRARDRAVDYLQTEYEAGRVPRGCDVDDACRAVVVEAGYGPHFVHRTGHSIGRDVHGGGANLDNLETRDERRLLPCTCFSIEPGIYLPGRMAVRTEIDVLVTADGRPEVTGPRQDQLVLVEV